VRADKGPGYALRLDLRHVTGNAPASGTTAFMVCVLFQSRGAWAFGEVGPWQSRQSWSAGLRSCA
jgi:hypothetical protein